MKFARPELSSICLSSLNYSKKRFRHSNLYLGFFVSIFSLVGDTLIYSLYHLLKHVVNAKLLKRYGRMCNKSKSCWVKLKPNAKMRISDWGPILFSKKSLGWTALPTASRIFKNSYFSRILFVVEENRVETS